MSSRYNSLILKVANELGIQQGTSESQTDWIVRVVYSILGRMAVASLLDMPEDGTVSEVHVKNRILDVLRTYQEMYPEIRSLFPLEPKELADEIFQTYLSTGVIYHQPYRVAMPIPSAAEFDGIRFTRGYPVDRQQSVSGLGTYVKSSTGNDLARLSEMFQLCGKSLEDYWNAALERASWKPYTPMQGAEYLRLTPPFTSSYWVSIPDTKSPYSLMRTGLPGSRLYYLYHHDRKSPAFSPLPQWLVENGQYRALACGCLSSIGALPSIKYTVDGNIVYFRFEYLPPPAELDLWKLYSWPQSCIVFPSHFKRISTKSVFIALKKAMETQGYQFTEE